MEPVLCLVEHYRLRVIQETLSDLFTVMGW
jgi:hypothetical protein